MVHLFYVSLFNGSLILRFFILWFTYITFLYLMVHLFYVFYLMDHLFYVSLFDGSLIVRYFF